MNKYTVFSFLAPIISPVAPATVLVNTLYKAMTETGIEHNYAIGAALMSGFGAELSGAVAAYATVQAYRKQKWGHFAVAFLAFALYIVFVGAGVASGHNPMALIIAVLVSIIAYLAVAVLEDLFRDGLEIQAVIGQKIELTKAEANKARALARQVEASNSSSLGVQNVQMDKTDTAKSAPRPENIEKVKEWLASNSGSDREAAKELKLSPTTVGKCREWLKENAA